MRAVITLLTLLGTVSLAAADTPFAVLSAPNARWTYQVVQGRKHKPTGVEATLVVTAVHQVGAYTVIETTTTFSPTPSPPDAFDVVPSAYIVGPDGLHEVLFFDASENGGYSEEHVASAYHDHHVPRAYLPAKLAAKKHVSWALHRFGDEDREYRVTGAITKLDAHTWRTAWKGRFEIPESGERTAYAWSTDFDPAVGFTQICTERDVCLRLAPM